MNIKLFILTSVIIALAYAHDEPEHMRIRRLEIEKEQGFDEITDAHLKNRTNRRLQAAWRPLKIYFDMSSINNDLQSQGYSDRVAFYKVVFEATGLWWGGALKVKDQRSKIWPLIQRYAPSYQRELGFVMENGANAEDYDLLIRVFLCENTGSALAYAGPFLRHPDSQRPITGTVCILPYGDANFKRAADSVNRGAGTVIHEFGHVISFISFDRYHQNNLKLKSSINRYIWTGPKVLEKARKYYNCSSLDGVPIQNNNGRIGGHWSETFLADELMTPTTGADPELVSPMSLALCEDTNWYKADYTFSENYTHNKNAGCSAFEQTCPSPQLCESGTSGFITSDYKGVGYCSTNSNGCNVERKYSNRDCMIGSKWPSSHADYGASYGANCVIAEGKFKRKSGSWIYSESQISVQAQCSHTNGSYTLTFKNFQQDSSGNHTGDAVVTCTHDGDKQFNTTSQYPSTVKCHDPKKFCAARFASSNGTGCDSTCRKNGRCQHVNPARRLQRPDCDNTNNTGDNTNTTNNTNNSGNTTPTPSNPGSGNTGGDEWMCWCYSDGVRRSACEDLPEDHDGQGY